jgi:oxygen-independent coproporphyrinogen-3 oxidase
MSPEQLGRLLASFDALFGLADNCEITVEAHPSTVNREKLEGFRSVGTTRLSTGAESLDSQELHALGRQHSAYRVLEVIELARRAGFSDVNVDLMYGVPSQTLESWNCTLHRILAAEPVHLSLYPLSIEPRTVYARRWKQHTLQVPDDDMVASMYHLACHRLRDAGYEHYEVANWAQPGHRSRHNLAYWYNREFYAVGVGAHGYLKPYRRENVTQTRRYIDRVLAGSSPVQTHTLIDRETELSETVMLRLRLLQDGLDLTEIHDRFGVDLARRFADDLSELTAAGLVRLDDRRLLLEESAVPVANEVWQRLIP